MPETLDNRTQAIILETTDLSVGIDEDILDKIGTHVVNVYEEDLESRRGWEEANEEWLKLATQVMEEKNYPWPGASNVKYPLLSTTALQFHARAYPALIPDGNLVKMRVLGKDPDNIKRERGNRVSQHMSYQLLEENENWQEDMDRLLYVLPIIGLCYKKTYYSPLKGYNESCLVLPDDVVINYYAEDYERAIKTHRMYQNENEIYELQAIGHYRDIELYKQEQPIEHEGVEDEITGQKAPDRSLLVEGAFDDVPYTILEQHTWWDLDGDGYKEPYIITVDRDTQTVLRIVARWTPDNVQFVGNPQNEEVARIVPTEYFTAFGFLPNPESKIYYQGFGQILGPINAASNTILNQLIDAGHLSTLQGGFLGKGIRMRGGKIKFKPGEWKVIQSTGNDIKNNIFPLPTKEPSGVLFNLLGLLIDSGENLGSIKDIMVGESPGQNQPYATTIAVLEQGMKVFVGIHKRLFRALSKEYKRLFKLNQIYFNQNKYFALLDSDATEIGPSDYETENLDIIPNADPSIISEAHKMLKAESLLQKKAAGLPLNTAEVTRRVVEVEGHEDIEKLLEPDPPSEDPELTFKKEELAAKMELERQKLQVNATNTQFEAFKDYAQALAHLAKAASTEAGVETAVFAELAKATKEEYDAITKRMQVVQNGMQEKEESSKQETSEE